MYKEPKFIKEIHQIRERMSKESKYDVHLFAEALRRKTYGKVRSKVLTKTS